MKLHLISESNYYGLDDDDRFVNKNLEEFYMPGNLVLAIHNGKLKGNLTPRLEYPYATAAAEGKEKIVSQIDGQGLFEFEIPNDLIEAVTEFLLNVNAPYWDPFLREIRYAVINKTLEQHGLSIDTEDDWRMRMEIAQGHIIEPTSVSVTVKFD
jgi:hypothetical protein